MAQKQWEPCPRCGSNRVQSRGTVFFALIGIVLIGISIWLLIIPPIGIAGIIFGALFLAIAPFTKSIVQCEDCKHSWKYPYKEKVIKKG